MRLSILAATGVIGLSMATAGIAAGVDTGQQPTPTQTTKKCKDGKVWDTKKKKCIDAVQGMFNDDFIFKNAREFAYAGQFDNAIRLLHLANNPDDPRILNYLGFANRKAGNVVLGMQYYRAALAIDPDYILARSYMGQALVLQGNMGGAWTQLAEIRDRGGKDTWAYRTLKQAINDTGTY